MEGNYRTQRPIAISIVVPVRDEEGNIREFHSRVSTLESVLDKRIEVIYVENGSTDSSLQLLQQLDNATVLSLLIDTGTKKTFQSAAIQAGIDYSNSDVIVTIDSDLQNAPEDIPLLLNTLSEKKVDCVVGWRQHRKGPIHFRIISFIGYLCRWLCGFREVHDPGCGLRACKKRALKDICLYGELQRFFPDLVAMNGYKIAEVKIPHYKRVTGISKYSCAKALRALIDLIGLWFRRKYADRPLQFFGIFGILFVIVGTSIWGVLGILRILDIVFLKNRIWPLFATTLLFIGLQLLFFGLIADILARIYFSQNKPYTIRQIIESDREN